MPHPAPGTPNPPEDWRRVDALNDEADAVLMSSMLRAQELAHEAYTLAVSSGYAAGAARAGMLRGYGHYFLGRFEDARTDFEGSLERAAALGLRALEARSLNGLAITDVQTGQFGRGLERHLACLRLVQSMHDDLGQCRSLNNIGNLYINLKEHERALKYHLDALDIATRIAHPIMISSASINAAIDYHDLEQYDEALRLNERSLQRARDGDLRQHECLLLANIAANLLGLGRADEALRSAQAAIALSEELGDQENLCDSLVTMGRVLRHQGRLPEAHAALERALHLAETLNIIPRVDAAHEHLSLVLEAQGAYAAALHHARTHDRISQQLTADVLLHKSQVLAAQLQVERLEHRAAEERLRNQELAQANAALQLAQERLAYQAQHDALTGLLNRAAFEGALQAAVQGPDTTLGVLFIDLDHFKQVNDTLGHPVGDALLIQVAERLSVCVRDGDLVARQGGDEFTVLLRNVQAHADVEAAAQRILDALSAPMDLVGRALVVTASIGIALFPHDGTDVTTLQKHADLAMYHAKRDRRSVRRFQPVLGDAALARLELEQDLRAALDRDELRLHYQPIVASDTLAPVAVEALVRWQHPTLGLLPPGRFVPVAEESDLMVGVGEWVLRAACRQLQVWRARWPDLRVSVNVAPRQFAQPDFAAFVERTLAAHDLDAGALELEVTESAVMDDHGMPQYEALLRAGLHLAIDDFGTGYSSMSRLFQLPAQVLKIDRSLITDLVAPREGHRSSRPIVRSLITFARESGLQVVAEGVEHEEQLQTLRAWQCDRVQGYFVARPAPPEELEVWLERHAR
ncbi:EAL domain-containing protein [Deinococcus maricopensis]|nr:EAL domain-containing protein [Deinococcus maricopensis]